MTHAEWTSPKTAPPARARRLVLGSPYRYAFSLVEVMAAMAICVLGLTVILQMAGLSQEFARKTQDLVEREILCQNRINEILAGARPAQNVSDQPCPENENVLFSVRVEPHTELPLARLEVTVRPRPAKPAAPAKGAPDENPTARRAEKHSAAFRLWRWIEPPADIPGAVSEPAAPNPWEPSQDETPQQESPE